jgi:hypothetical protein
MIEWGDAYHHFHKPQPLRVAEVKRLLSHLNQGGPELAASCIAMRFQTRC